MPKRSTIDAPGALHHIITRGIERGEIFKDDADRRQFIDQLAELSRKLDISETAVSLSVKRGEKLTPENGYSLL